MKKIISLIMAILMLSVMAVSCAKDKESTDTSSESASATVAEKKPVLKMATNAEFPPYEYYDDNGKIVGIDAEIAAAIAEKIGMELVIEDMKFDSIITSVKTGTDYIGVAGLTVTDERKEEIDFSSSYATGVQVIIVKEGSTIASADDLAGKKIGVQLATTGDIYATGDFGTNEDGSENGLVVKYNKGADAVAALKGGDVDAVVIDNEPAKSFVAANEGLKILETEYAVEEYAIAVNKGNKELLDKINKAIEELTEDGTIDRIVAKYIKSN